MISLAIKRSEAHTDNLLATSVEKLRDLISLCEGLMKELGNKREAHDNMVKQKNKEFTDMTRIKDFEIEK